MSTNTNTLVNLGGTVTSGGTNDFGLGRLDWTGLHINAVNFVTGNYPNPDPENPAIAVNRFGFAVPNEGALPLLEISRINAVQIRCSWLTNAVGYNLQSTATLPALQWIAVTNAPAVTGQHFQVEVDATNAQQFFRLEKQ